MMRSLRQRLLVVSGALAGLTVVVLVASLLYLNFADLSVYRGTAEKALSELLGRELSIAGPFEPEFGLRSSLVAGDIKLANPGWCSDPTMVHIDHFSITVDLWSLVSGPVVLHELEVRGVRVLLETDSDGRSNWEFETTDAEETEADEVLAIVLEHAGIEEFVVEYRDPSREGPLELSLARVEIRTAEGDMLDLAIDGRINRAPLTLSGQVGPLSGLLEGEDVEVELAGNAGGANLAVLARVADLATLAGTTATVEVRGSDLYAVTEAFDLPSVGEGPFRLTTNVAPSLRSFEFSLDADFGGVTFDADGVVDSLVEPAALDLTVAASGPDLAAVGALAGVGDLPDDAFSVSGRVHWEGFPITFEEVSVNIGQNTASLDGVLGALPQMLETDFRFRAAGPDLSAFRGVAGVDLPPGRFSAEGHLIRVENGVGVNSVVARVGETMLEMRGFVGDPPELAGTKLRVDVAGSDLSDFEGLAGVDLPAEPFEVRGSFEYADEGLALDSGEFRVGQNSVRANGTVRVVDGFAGTNVLLHMEGPDLSQAGLLAGQTGLPGDPFRVDGRVRVLEDGYALDTVTAQLADVVVNAEGRVGPLPELVGTDLRLDVRGPDLSWVGLLVGRQDLPADPFRVTAGVQVLDDGYRLQAVDALFGDVAVKVDGRVGPPPELEGTKLSVDVRAGRLSALGAYVDRPLPDEPFAVSGNVRVEGDEYWLDRVVVELGATRIDVDGAVVPSSGLVGTRIELAVAGPDLASFGRLVSESGFGEPPDLPTASFSVEGGLEIDDAGYVLRALEVKLGRGEASLDGRIGEPPAFGGTDLTVDARGPDVSPYGALAGLALPAEPFRARGRVELLESGARFHGVSAEFGAYHADVNGTVGEPPKFIGTQLDVRASGPSFALIGDLADRPGLPDEAFELSGHFEGTPEQFTMRDFTARLGANDLRGSLQVDLREKPAIVGKFHSDQLDLSAFLGGNEDEQEQTEEKASAEEAEEVAELLIPDEPLDLEVLQSVNANVSVTVGDLVLFPLRVSDIRLGVRLLDGSLHVDPFSATEETGGTIEGDFALEPAGEDYRVQARLLVEGFKVDLTKAEDDWSEWAPLAIDLDFGGTGRSPHTIAGNASGRLQVFVGEGMMDNTLLDLLVAGVFRELIGVLNPFAKRDKLTKIDCVVFAANLEEGAAWLEPVVLRTNKMVMTGHGEIDLATEDLDIVWVTKPRKGIGLSASALTNPFIGLGGTLAAPRIQSKGVEGAAKGSLSILTLGVWDRITSEGKVCKKALKQIEKQERKRSMNQVEGSAQP